MDRRRPIVTLGLGVLPVVATFTAMVRAAEQNPQLAGSPARPARDPGGTLPATLANGVYAPLRFAVTVGAAALGGCVVRINGGDPEAAAAVWENTDGEAFFTLGTIE